MFDIFRKIISKVPKSKYQCSKVEVFPVSRVYYSGESSKQEILLFTRLELSYIMATFLLCNSLITFISESSFYVKQFKSES